MGDIYLKEKEYLEIGQIVNTYGIKGFVKVVPYTDNIERFEQLDTIYLDYKSKLIKMNIEEVKYSKHLVLLKLKEILDINMAENYKGCYIKIDRKDAVELPKNSYFIVDLIGLEVYTEDNILLGNVEDIFSTR